MALTKIFTGMVQGPEKINDNFNSLDTIINTLNTDTGWVKVSLMNGMNGDISVRLRDGVIYHKGYFNAITSKLAVFKYPDNFGDMSDFGENNSGWAAFTYAGEVNYGYIKGATKEFFCWKVNITDATSVSNITFKL